MQITDPLNNPRLFIEQTRTETLSQLRSGQVVTAQVIKPTTNGVAQIDIGGMKLPVETGVKLEIGQQLALNVVKGGSAPELQLIRNMTPDTVQALALKRILPQQLPIHQLLDSLSSLNTTTTAPSLEGSKVAQLLNQIIQQLAAHTGQAQKPQNISNNPLDRNLQTLTSLLQSTANPPGAPSANKLPGSLAQQIHQLINQVSTGNSPVTATAIRQAFEHSGLFLESQLAGGHAVGTDFKASLLRLLAELQPLVASSPIAGDPVAVRAADTATTLQLMAARLFAELQQLSDGTLARIQLHQLASLPQDDSNLRQAWQFELPIPHPEGHDNFFIRFEKEVSPSDPTAVRWSVVLNFDIPPAGPISAKINLEGDIISSHFTAERAEGVARLESALPKLSEALEKAGLTIGRLSARQGKARQTDDLPIPPFPLLDEKA
ncbi:MAG: flagellar hook-length control protein FliK [Sedimenticola sp.]|nr:flagellar hook-length control protein FliK [Sedimenticola sp.]